VISNFLDTRTHDRDSKSGEALDDDAFLARLPRWRSSCTSCQPPLAMVVSPRQLELMQASDQIDVVVDGEKVRRFLRNTDALVVLDLGDADDNDTTNPSTPTPESPSETQLSDPPDNPAASSDSSLVDAIVANGAALDALAAAVAAKLGGR